MKLKLLLTLFIISQTLNLSAQRWKGERSSIIFTAGTANYMGDLGGGSKEAAHFLGLRDIDIQGTRFNVGFGYEHRVWERLSVRTSFSYAQLYGSDKFTDNLIRHNRNLHFKSNVWGGDLFLLFCLKKHRNINRYSPGSYLYKDWLRTKMYIISGVGFFNYSTRTKYHNEWIKTQSLITEENKLYIDNKLPSYNLNTGFGVGYTYDRYISIAIEITNKYTSTDYIDDVSGNYYDNVIYFAKNTAT